VAANLRVGTRLLASALVFVGVSFVFAFFYLKALNSAHDFRPAGVSPPQGYGVVILVCVLLAAALFAFGRDRVGEGPWRAAAIGSLVLGLVALVVQLIEYHELHFKTASGGYASVFWGWTLMFLLIWLGGLFVVETLVARTLRGAEVDELRPSAASALVYLLTAAGLQLVGYILLYLVK
jgi:hypothetical protein